MITEQQLNAICSQHIFMCMLIFSIPPVCNNVKVQCVGLMGIYWQNLKNIYIYLICVHNHLSERDQVISVPHHHWFSCILYWGVSLPTLHCTSMPGKYLAYPNTVHSMSEICKKKKNAKVQLKLITSIVEVTSH